MPHPISSISIQTNLLESLDSYDYATNFSYRTCASSFMQPYEWSIHLIELIAAVISLVINICVTTFTHNAIPLPIPQRCCMAWITMNYAFLGGFQFSRNIFLLMSLYDPCIAVTTTVKCKLQGFPLIYCYLHAAVLMLILSSMTFRSMKEDRKLLSWTTSCSIWQSLIAATCIAAALIFTAFDEDRLNNVLPQCSILIAIRERQLGFWLLAMMIVMHTASMVLISLSSWFQFEESSLKVLWTLSLKDVILTETLLWQIALLFSGILSVYQFVAKSVCEQCLGIALEVSFVILPLIISFFHPFLIIWHILPLRDAAVRIFPSLSFIVPEYSFIPPPPVHGLLSSGKYSEIGLNVPKVIGREQGDPVKHKTLPKIIIS